MKKVLKVIWGIFAVIGILLTLRLIPVFCGNQSISIYRSTKGHYSDYVELLRTSGAFGKDTTTFEMKILQDTARAKEIREHYISGEKMQYHPKFKRATTKVSQHYSYMAKNTYWFMCWETLSYYQEEWKDKKRETGRDIVLVPSGFEPFYLKDGAVVTTDADTFWAAPKKQCF